MPPSALTTTCWLGETLLALAFGETVSTIGLADGLAHTVSVPAPAAELQPATVAPAATPTAPVITPRRLKRRRPIPRRPIDPSFPAGRAASSRTEGAPAHPEGGARWRDRVRSATLLCTGNRRNPVSGGIRRIVGYMS
ncbi:hypothetical protein GCM10023322_26100 [Rugosimonospora acidiphila]|uniref:Uncharacterized protein n=1 Tax=Rugosimonospora acidiphila TaxID=556531 RepID=A0ABP9RQD3_9ACTN